MSGIIRDEAQKLARTPGRWRQLFYPRRWRQFFSVLFFNARAGGWKAVSGSEQFQQRQWIALNGSPAFANSGNTYGNASRIGVMAGVRHKF